MTLGLEPATAPGVDAPLAPTEAPVTVAAVPELRLRTGEIDRAQLRDRAQRLRVHPLLVRLLHGRAVDDEAEQRRILAPRLGQLRPPEAMAGFVEALDLLAAARTHGWRVGVFGDYDVDGVTTAAIVTTYLEALGLQVVARVAHRDRGYGLGIEDARAFAQSKCELVVTGDVGTSDVEALGELRAAGIKTVVIDHHQVPQALPPTDAFINPHQPDCAFPFKGLCSAGVAFYLCAGLRSRLRQTVAAPDPRGWLDLVALATVCDMMPLRDENRVLTAAGLRHLQRRTRPGLAALLQVAGVDADEPVNETHVGFKLGPRLNAPGRLGSAEPALRLLRAGTAIEAGPLAEQIEMLNARRRHLTDTIVAQAKALLLADRGALDRSAIVVAHDGWACGVAGIAAARLAEDHGRPAMVLAIDPETGVAQGSVRSFGTVDVRAALQQCTGLLLRHGGHPQAAGVTLRADRVEELAEAFCAAVDQAGAVARTNGEVEVVDCVLPLRVVEERLCAAVRSLGPYGVGFEPPRFAAQGLTVERVRVLKERHLSLTLSQDGTRREAMAFSQAHHDLEPGQQIDCIFSAELDHFRGESRLRLHIDRLWQSP